VDLSLQHAQIADEVRLGFDRVLDSGAFILGPEVKSFEDSFARYCDVSHVIGVGNGTDAVELALRAAGIGAGDEVLVPANTFVATVGAVLRAGAAPRLVDCDDDFLIDADAAAQAATSRTRAVIGVHLYGQVAPMERLRHLFGDRLVLVEDAAQSQGARLGRRRAGSLGDIAATSFYPGKNLGAYGDGGAVMTADDELAERVQLLRNHGGIRRYEHDRVGVNSRLDSLQAVVLSSKLALLDAWNEQRREAAERYRSWLQDVPGVVLPRTVAGNGHVFHLYVVRVPDRDRVVQKLNDAGIGAAIHYPTPVHLLKGYASLGYTRGDFPAAERAADEIMSLPIYPGITPEQQERVVAELRRALKG